VVLGTTQLIRSCVGSHVLSIASGLDGGIGLMQWILVLIVNGTENDTAFVVPTAQ
jgi:hypothetical protein